MYIYNTLLLLLFAIKTLCSLWGKIRDLRKAEQSKLNFWVWPLVNLYT